MKFIRQILFIFLIWITNQVNASVITFKIELSSSTGAYIDALPNKTIQNLAPDDQIVGKIKKTRIRENGSIVEKEI